MPFFSIRPTATYSIRSRRGVLAFLLRQVITQGYVVAGYKDTVTWRNVNRVNHATDVTTNLGNLLQSGGSYVGGGHNKNNGFIWGVNGTGTQGWGTFSGASCFNLRNDTTKTLTAGHSPYTNVGMSFGLMNHNENGDADFCWYTGNFTSNYIARFAFATETHTGQLSTSFTNGNGDTGGGSAGILNENFGIWYNDVPQNFKWTYATQTESNYPATPSAHSQQKSMSTKLGFSYAGNEGNYNGGNSFRKHNLTTETNTGVLYAKPVQNSGEENYDMGQDHGYMLGMYNGAQNNLSFRWNYNTDSGFQGSASMQPTGSASGETGATTANIEGRSSGVGMWRD